MRRRSAGSICGRCWRRGWGGTKYWNLSSGHPRPAQLHDAVRRVHRRVRRVRAFRRRDRPQTRVWIVAFSLTYSITGRDAADRHSPNASCRTRYGVTVREVAVGRGAHRCCRRTNGPAAAVEIPPVLARALCGRSAHSRPALAMRTNQPARTKRRGLAWGAGPVLEIIKGLECHGEFPLSAA